MLKPFAFASTLAAVLAATVAARADFATPPGAVAVVEPAPHALAVAAPPPPRDLAVAAPAADKPDTFMAVRFEGGPAWATMRSLGGYGRLTLEALAVPHPKGTSAVFGIWEGIEGWGARFGAAGVSVPVVGEIGFKTHAVIGTIGGGVNVISFEQLGHAKGVGGFQPRAGARFGLNLDSVYLVATADVQRRWQTNLPTINMYQVGFAIGAVLDTKKLK